MDPDTYRKANLPIVLSELEYYASDFGKITAAADKESDQNSHIFELNDAPPGQGHLSGGRKGLYVWSTYFYG